MKENFPENRLNLFKDNVYIPVISDEDWRRIRLDKLQEKKLKISKSRGVYQWLWFFK